MKQRLFSPVLTGLLVVALTGCATPGEIQFATGRRAAVSPDGLHAIETWGPRSVRVFVKPGVDLHPYDKVMLEPVIVRVGLMSPRTPDRETIALAKQSFREIFESELGRSEVYELVTEPGPDVLRVTPQLVDLVITTPPGPRSPDERLIISSAGEVTLVLELSDSRTHAVLVRAFDRRSLGNETGSAFRDQAGAGLSNARLIFVQWAQRLRGWLDAVREIPPLPAEDEAVPDGGDGARAS